MVESGSEAVDVGAQVDVAFSLGLLGAYVEGRPHGRACHGEALLVVRAFGQTEVAQFDLAIVGEDKGVGLDVAVDELGFAPSVS